MSEKEAVINEVIKLQRRVNRTLRQYTPNAWMDLNLTIAQLKSLFFIAEEGSTNFRRLAAALGVTPSNMTGIVDRLVKQGLVSRQESPEDRRMLLLETTDKGRALLAKLRESRITRLSDILAQLSLAELSALAQGFAALARAAGGKKEKL